MKKVQAFLSTNFVINCLGDNLKLKISVVLRKGRLAVLKRFKGQPWSFSNLMTNPKLESHSLGLTQFMQIVYGYGYFLTKLSSFWLTCLQVSLPHYRGSTTVTSTTLITLA